MTSAKMTEDDKIRMAEADMLSSHPEVMAEGALLRSHPELYKGFETATLSLHGAGYRKFSQWMVANYVRYNIMMTQRGFEPAGEDEYKVPNGVIAIWARRFICNYPHMSYVFSIKRLSHGVDDGDDG